MHSGVMRTHIPTLIYPRTRQIPSPGNRGALDQRPPWFNAPLLLTGQEYPCENNHALQGSFIYNKTLLLIHCTWAMHYLKRLSCTALNQISACYKNFCLKLNSDKTLYVNQKCHPFLKEHSYFNLNNRIIYLRLQNNQCSKQ